MLRGGVALVALPQDLGETDVHVRRAPQRTRPVVGDQLQALFVETLRVAQVPLGHADVGHRDRESEDVGDVADAPHAGDRLGVGGERTVEVAVRPRCQPEQRVRRRVFEVVVGGDGEHAARVRDGGGDVTASQGHGGAVHLDRARQRSELGVVDHDHARGVPVGGVHRQPALDLVEVGLDAIGLAVRHEGADEADGEHRADPYDVLRNELRPVAERRVLAGSSHLRHRELGQLRGAVEIARCECVPDGVGRLALLGEPGAGAAMELDGCVGLLLEESCAQHVGEEVVVPVPLAPVVERDHEQVLAVERFERGLASGLAGHRVAERTLQPVEDRRLQQELTDVSGWRCSTSPTR